MKSNRFERAARPTWLSLGLVAALTSPALLWPRPVEAAIMSAAIDNFVLQNDARWNNISGLPPCFRCNLFDMSIGTNVWERNLGTFNLTDACAP